MCNAALTTSDVSCTHEIVDSLYMYVRPYIVSVVSVVTDLNSLCQEIEKKVIGYEV